MPERLYASSNYLQQTPPSSTTLMLGTQHDDRNTPAKTCTCPPPHRRSLTHTPSDRCTPGHLAAQKGQAAVCNALGTFEENGRLLSEPDKHGANSAHYACEAGQVFPAPSEGSAQACCASMRVKDWSNAAILCINRWKSAWASEEAPDAHSAPGHSPPRSLARRPQASVVEALVAHHPALFRVEDEQGRTPADRACEKGQLDVVRALSKGKLLKGKGLGEAAVRVRGHVRSPTDDGAGRFGG